ncbi:metal-dependent hydrolase [Photobacterium lutimaris]|uniref:Metal-dependent hydrolase n=1 Tax=Photobacterium lutimaris TaxID=388278 RepID=A0A2T3IY29_9GAMM|nr:metal-dependent hydrolase [Photobacterium lutimaris]PSU33431.1 metal-dependent hydrolase [Photobacterium lutimaris]TDR75067.1 inner membrane protein [Photobacterium lutimaris]
MDSVTQAALGAAVAGAVAGRKCTPKVLLAGAALGSLPDLDVLLSYGDPVSDMVKHRGFSHSLFVLMPFSLLLAWLWQKWRPTCFSFGHLWLLVTACLVTHPLLDSLTAYGTQLFWPINIPIAIPSLFIIDPLYTIPLLVVLLASLLWRDRMAKLCTVGLAVSSLYIAWSLTAMNMIESRVEQQLAGTPLAGQPVFITPTPFNTVLWRIVVQDEESYFEGLSSVIDGDTEIDFLQKPLGTWPAGLASEHQQMLEHFTGGFIRYEQRQSALVASDLRLGIGEQLAFQFALADNSNEWTAIEPIRVEGAKARLAQIPNLWLRLLGSQDIDANLCHISECPQEAVPLASR